MRLPRPFKSNPRKLTRANFDPIRARLQYIVDYCYGGNKSRFARAIGVDPKVLDYAAKVKSPVNVRLLIHIVMYGPIRAEWLLCGAGPMLVGQSAAPKEIPGLLELPTALKTRYPFFDTLTVGVPPAFVTVPEAIAELPDESAMSAEHIAAAQAIHTARVADKPVVCFLGAQALAAGAGIVAGAFLTHQYVTGIATTGQGLVRDIRAAHITSPPDLNYIARLAANNGIGYGEAIGRWGFDKRDEKHRSIVNAAYRIGVPVTAHIELGEIDQHASTTVRGAELGAAIGAASYTDFLILTEQIRALLSGPVGGVFVVAGEAERGLNLFFRAYAAVKAAGITPTEFTVIIMGNTHQPHFQEQVRSHGGHYYTLQGNYRANVCHLLEACTAVYSGKIPNDLRQKPSIEPRTEVN